MVNLESAGLVKNGFHRNTTRRTIVNVCRGTDLRTDRLRAPSNFFSMPASSPPRSGGPIFLGRFGDTGERIRFCDSTFTGMVPIRGPFSTSYLCDFYVSRFLPVKKHVDGSLLVAGISSCEIAIVEIWMWFEVWLFGSRTLDVICSCELEIARKWTAETKFRKVCFTVLRKLELQRNLHQVETSFQLQRIIIIIYFALFSFHRRIRYPRTMGNFLFRQFYRFLRPMKF